MREALEADKLGDGDVEEAFGLTFAGDSMRPPEDGSSTAEHDGRPRRPTVKRKPGRAFRLGFGNRLMLTDIPERRRRDLHKRNLCRLKVKMD